MTSYELFLELVQLETDECIIWPRARTRGYGVLNINGRMRRAHRVALQLRTGEQGFGLHAAHGDCHNTACMNYRHLRWATAHENAADKLRDGTDHRGSQNAAARLTEADVRFIRESAASTADLAVRFGVNKRTIRKARSGETWGHIPLQVRSAA